MFERFCPNIHGICREGHADHSEHLCMYWDSLNEECTMAKSMQLNADGFRLTIDLIRQKVETAEEIAKKVREGKMSVKEGEMELEE